jgi:hypothetical protein
MTVADHPEDARCGFCGRGPDEVNRIVAGLTSWICDSCITACYEILSQVEYLTDSAADQARPEADGVLAGIGAATTARISGDEAAARGILETLWAEQEGDSDPLDQAIIAHYMADLQDGAEAALTWNLRAVEAAERVAAPDDELSAIPEPWRGLRPSLYLNAARDLAAMGRNAEAGEFLTRADDCLVDLPESGYGRLVRDDVNALRSDLSTQQQ